MGIITLTSDWGWKDYYVGAVKGNILKKAPNTQIVDLSHEISSFDIVQAAFIVKNCYEHFPPDTVHIIAVDSIARDTQNLFNKTSHIVVKANGHYFIGADNGLFSLILDVVADQIIEIQGRDHLEAHFFPSKTLFVEAACHIVNGGDMTQLGNPKPYFVERRNLQPTISENFLAGNIIHVDRFGNIITNIKKDYFIEIVQNRTFAIVIRRGDYTLTELSTSYNQVLEGEIVAFFNSIGVLELAINKGNAAQLLGLHVGQSIRIDFS